MKEEKDRMFPVLGEKPPCPQRIPWWLLAPYEERAVDNHDQSLQRLADRGGLCAGEIRCLVQGRKLFDQPWTSERNREDVAWLITWLRMNTKAEKSTTFCEGVLSRSFIHKRGVESTGFVCVRADDLTRLLFIAEVAETCLVGQDSPVTRAVFAGISAALTTNNLAALDVLFKQARNRKEP